MGMRETKNLELTTDNERVHAEGVETAKEWDK